MSLTSRSAFPRLFLPPPSSLLEPHPPFFCTPSSGISSATSLVAHVWHCSSLFSQYMCLSQTPYPSFTTVMTTAGLAPRRTACLPTYHSTHLRQYHPYSMTFRHHDKDYLMVGRPVSVVAHAGAVSTLVAPDCVQCGRCLPVALDGLITLAPCH